MDIRVIRATETWQRAGAYYVRIQGMARQHGITLRREFDDMDTPETKYIVLTDWDFPVATCRFYPLDDTSAMIGRVVVLPEYRGKGIATKLLERVCADALADGYEAVEVYPAKQTENVTLAFTG